MEMSIDLRISESESDADYKGKKVKEPHLRVTGSHLPYGITHLTQVTQPCRLGLDLPTPEGWKAELTLLT